MKNNRALENISTKRLIPISILVIIGVPIAVTILTEANVIDVDKFSTIVDSTVKIIGLIVGFLWFANRYFVNRIDFQHLKVEGVVNKFKMDDSANKHLLNYNTQITNSGETLIKELSHYIEIQEIKIVADEVVFETIYRFPDNGYHKGINIEPDSWIALNDSFIVKDDIKVVRIFIEMNIDNKRDWTWHKDFEITLKNNNHE